MLLLLAARAAATAAAAVALLGGKLGTALAQDAGGLDPALFEDGFCSSPDASGDGPVELNTNRMTCSKLMEFVYF